MAWIDVPAFGQSYQARNKRFANTNTVNFYPHVSKDARSRESVSLEPMPGLSLFGSAGSGKNRGAAKHNNLLYAVNGEELYEFNSSGTPTLIGSITGENPVEMDTDGINLVIATGGNGYVYNTSLIQITDGDYNNSRTVNYFNDRFLYDTQTGWVASDIGLPASITSANAAGVVSTKDAGGSILGVFSFGQKYYPFSKTTIESWWNPGGAVNFQREDFVFDQGVAGSYAVGNNSNFVYLLGSDRVPYRFSGLSKQSIGNQSIGQEFQGYLDVSDCKVICQEWDNENFAWFIFPSANKSWLFHEESNTWWRMAGGLGLDRHPINQAIEVFNKKLICDYDNGNIYEMDWSNYTNNGRAMYWEIESPPITAKTLQLPPRKLFIQGCRIVLETGHAPVTGQGASPQLMLSWSKDNGVSYIGEINLDCGTSGDRNREVVYHSGMGWIESYENLQIKLRMSDPQRWAISDMQINVEVGV